MDLVDRLVEIVPEVHDDARLAAESLLSAENQIKLLEKLCRDGQQDKEGALGIATLLSPDVKDKASPWCKIMVRYDLPEDDGEDAGPQNGRRTTAAGKAAVRAE